MKLSKKAKRGLKNLLIYVSFFMITEATFIIAGLYFLNDYSFIF